MHDMTIPAQTAHVEEPLLPVLSTAPTALCPTDTVPISPAPSNRDYVTCTIAAIQQLCIQYDYQYNHDDAVAWMSIIWLDTTYGMQEAYSHDLPEFVRPRLNWYHNSSTYRRQMELSRHYNLRYLENLCK